MRSFPLRGLALGAAVGAAIAAASCLHARPPQVTPSSSLAPSSSGAGPRTKAPFQVVFAGPHDTVTDREEAAVTILFNRPMRTFECARHRGVAGRGTSHGAGPNHRRRVALHRNARVALHAQSSPPRVHEIHGHRAGRHACPRRRRAHERLQAHVLDRRARGHELEPQGRRARFYARTRRSSWSGTSRWTPAAVEKKARLLARGRPGDKVKTARRARGASQNEQVLPGRGRGSVRGAYPRGTVASRPCHRSGRGPGAFRAGRAAREQRHRSRSRRDRTVPSRSRTFAVPGRARGAAKRTATSRSSCPTTWLPPSFART